MSHQPIRFYQTGTFTVGNRLLPSEERSVQADLGRTNSLNSGHRACQGCGEALGARYAIDAAMAATDRQLVADSSHRHFPDLRRQLRPFRERRKRRTQLALRASRPPSRRTHPQW